MSIYKLEFEGRSLQLRPEQLSVSSIAKAFRLVEGTIILVSDRGTVAIPDAQEGLFHDADPLEVWTVQGDKATGPRVVGSSAATGRWRPQSFPPLIRASGNPGPGSRQSSVSYSS